MKPAREARIAAAIQRSKEEYQPVHAYTERGHAVQNGDKHGMVSRLYHAGDDNGVLEIVREAFEDNKPLGGLPREIIDTAMRSSLRLGRNGVDLARSTRSLWRGHSAGIVVVVADCFLQQALYREALEPLLISSAQSLHVPVLERLSRVLGELGQEGFRTDIERYIKKEPRQGQYDVSLGLEGELFAAQEGTIRRLHKDTQDTIRFVREL